MSKFLQNLFGDSTPVPYPNAPTSGAAVCGSAPYQPAANDGFLNRMFTPELLAYPLPACPLPTAMVPMLPTAPTTPTALPATFAPVPSALPTAAATRIIRGYLPSPEISSSYAEGHAAFMASEVGEVLTQQLESFDSQTLALIVPDGFDTLELSFGAIEANPGAGAAEDADELIAIGTPRTSKAISAGLVAGDQVSLVVPWRAASWVDMPAGRLRVKVTAIFSKSQS